MSHIETIMLILLGLTGALLIALLIGRLFWGQAINLGKRRSRRESPATITELRAEKDKLRAEYAMLSRKLELRLNDLKTRLAEQTAEVSRNRNRVDILVSEIRQRDEKISKLVTENENYIKQMVPLESELAARTQTIQQLREQLRDRDAQIAELTLQLDATRIDLANASKPVPTPVPGAIASHATGNNAIQSRLEQRIADLTSLSAQIENQRKLLTRQHSELKDLFDGIPQEKKQAKRKSGKKKPSKKTRKITSELEKKLLDTERETLALQAQLDELDREWDEKLKELEASPADETKIVLPDKNGKGKKKGRDKDDDDDLTNVITLANRIRSLQKDIKG